MSTAPMSHAWLPRASCNESCVRADQSRTEMRVLRGTVRALMVVMLLPAMPLLAIPHPGRGHAARLCCRVVLRCVGVRITKSGGPIRNVPGVLVVSPHMSWIDVLVICALMPATIVAKAEVTRGPGLSMVARVMNVIPIERARLRSLPDVVDAVATRLRSGRSVVAFPEGTTWCGLAYGQFRPALFQAAIDAGRPVQPLRLSYHHRDGRPSTVPAFVGKDSLPASFLRVLTAPRTIAHVGVEALQLPGRHRRDLAMRCQLAVRGVAEPHHERALVG